MNIIESENNYIINTNLLEKDPILMLMKSMIDKCDVHECVICRDIKMSTGIIIKG